MPKLGDGIEASVAAGEEAFAQLGDVKALTDHGCLTVAQCAVVLLLTEGKSRSGDSTDIAASYIQLALLDISNGRLSARHPSTLLPWSQYQRMLSAGMYGADGAAAPMPDAGWLVDLVEVERWYATHGIKLNMEKLRADLSALRSGLAAAVDRRIGAAVESPQTRRPGQQWTAVELAELAAYREVHGPTAAGKKFGISRQRVGQLLDPAGPPAQTGYSAFNPTKK